MAAVRDPYKLDAFGNRAEPLVELLVADGVLVRPIEVDRTYDFIQSVDLLTWVACRHLCTVAAVMKQDAVPGLGTGHQPVEPFANGLCRGVGIRQHLDVRLVKTTFGLQKVAHVRNVVHAALQLISWIGVDPNKQCLIHRRHPPYLKSRVIGRVLPRQRRQGSCGSRQPGRYWPSTKNASIVPMKPDVESRHLVAVSAAVPPQRTFPQLKRVDPEGPTALFTSR